MQDEPGYKSNLEGQPDPTAPPTAAQLAAIDLKVKDAVQSEVTAAAAAGKLQAASVKAWRTITWIVCLVAVFMFGVLLLDEVNLIDLPRFGAAIDPTAVPAALTTSEKEDAQVTGLSDLLAAILPLFTIAIAFFVGATGLQRLALYDEQFATARSERREDMADLRREIAENVKSSREALDADLKAAIENQRAFENRLSAGIVETATKVALDSFGSSKEEVEKFIKKVEEKADGISNSIDEKIKPLDWILTSKETTEALSEGSVGSMGELKRLIEELFEKKEHRAAVTLVEQSLKANLLGDANDYFNTATNLARRNLEPLAFAVSMAGLKLFARNGDLLANALKYSAPSGKMAEGNKIYETITALPEVEKGWRIRVFVADFLKDTQGVPAAEKYLLGYMARFFDASTWVLKKHLPADAFSEKVAANLLQLYESSGRSAEVERIALAVLESASKAPQTAGTLARSYLSVGQYKSAIDMADRGIRDDATDQSVTNLGSLLHVKANAYDSLFLASAKPSTQNSEETLELARLAFSHYGSTLSAPDRLANPREISLRATAMVAKLIEIGVPEADVRSMIPDVLNGLVKVPSTGAGGKETLNARLQKYGNEAQAISQLSADQIETAINGLAQRIVAESAAEELITVRAALSAAADQYAEDQPAFADVLRKLGNRLAN